MSVSDSDEFISSVWKGPNNVRGFTVPRHARETLFNQNLQSIQLFLPDADVPITVHLAPSFWRKCNHLNNTQTTSWLSERGFSDWIRGKPPKFIVRKLDEGSFLIVSVLASR